MPLTSPHCQGRRIAPSAYWPAGSASPVVSVIQDDFPEEHGAYIVFTSVANDRHSRPQQHREVNAVATAAPEFMHWSEKPISWSRADHPEVMPAPGSYALVLDATFSIERELLASP